MTEKHPRSGGLIKDYISGILKICVGNHSGKLLFYADGLTTMRKKGIKAMIPALNCNYHTSYIVRILKNEHNMLDTFKHHQIVRNDKIDKRKRYFIIIDDTAHKRYGKNIYGSGLNHSGSENGSAKTCHYDWGNNKFIELVIPFEDFFCVNKD